MFSESGKISFKYIKELHNIQNTKDFKFANRLSSCHINFKQKKKMKVSLAVQTISSSVADAINYLRIIACEQFHDSDATCEFLYMIVCLIH